VKCQAASCSDSHVALIVVCLLQVHDGTTTPLNQFMKDPDSLITRVTWKDEQDKVGSAAVINCSSNTAWPVQQLLVAGLDSEYLAGGCGI
jgi:hypothetical protein